MRAKCRFGGEGEEGRWLWWGTRRVWLIQIRELCVYVQQRQIGGKERKRTGGKLLFGRRA